MNHLGAIIGAAVGAAVGGIIWAVVAYAAHVEVGWIAWGVGLLAGGGAAIGARGNADAVTGSVAALCAVAAILVAKYAVIHVMVKGELEKMTTSFQSEGLPGLDDEEYWIGHVADSLIESKIAAGECIDWPGGAEPEYAEVEADYPKAVWADAKARWKAMETQARTSYRESAQQYASQQMAAMVSEIQSEATGRGFFESFGAFDLLFGTLAIITAFKVGSTDIGSANAA